MQGDYSLVRERCTQNKASRGKCKNKIKLYEVCRDRNQISDCLELGVEGRNCLQKDRRELCLMEIQ